MNVIYTSDGYILTQAMYDELQATVNRLQTELKTLRDEATAVTLERDALKREADAAVPDMDVIYKHTVASFRRYTVTDQLNEYSRNGWEFLGWLDADWRGLQTFQLEREAILRQTTLVRHT